MATQVNAAPQLNPGNAHEITNDAEKNHRPASTTSTEATMYEKSPGVRRIEAISSCFTKWHRVLLFVSIFLLAYCYGLDGTVRYTLQVYALASFGTSASISTVTVVRSIVAAAAQPVYAKISDFFGRPSILALSLFFYILGTIVQAASKNLATFSGGAVINQFGVYTGLMLLVEIIIADTTGLRNRLLFSFIPAAPFLVNAWISGNVANASLQGAGWQWGIGMWAIIFSVVGLPLFTSFFLAKRRAKAQGLLKDIPKQNLMSWQLWKDFAIHVDFVGLLLLAATLALCLIPFTIAGGTASLWRTPKVIVTLVVGFVVALPLFILWETKFAKHPILPGRLLRDRQVFCALGIALMLNTTWYTQGDYLYYTLVVAFNKPIETATRVTSIYSFVSVVIGFSLGLVARYLRRLKMFIIAGALLIILAFGLLIRYRGGTSPADFAGLVGAEVVLGIGGGLLPYSAQVLIQSAVKHERTAVVTSLFYATYNVGSALGNTIAAAIWTNTLPGKLAHNFEGISNGTALAASAYADPFTFIVSYPLGTPEREAVDTSYYQVQRLLCITGICLALVLFAFTLGLRDVTLGDEQSLEDAEEEKATEKDHSKRSEQVHST